MSHTKKKIITTILIAVPLVAFASYLIINEPYIPDCDACNSAAIDRAGYRALGKLQPRKTYTFIFKDNMQASFYFSSPLSTYAFQQRGNATKCAYSCHQQNDKGSN